MNYTLMNYIINNSQLDADVEEIRKVSDHGNELPTNVRTLKPGYHYVLDTDSKIYALKCTNTMNNELDDCINIRKGACYWMEIDSGIKVRITRDYSHIRKYPDASMIDILDVINYIYLKIDYASDYTISFINDIRNPQNSNIHIISIIESYTCAKMTDTLKESLLQNKDNYISDIIKAIVYIFFMNY